MPKAILEFNLPEEKTEWEPTCNAMKYCFIISEIVNRLRNAIKHQNLDETELKVYEEIRGMLWEELRDAGIDNEF